MKIVYLKSATQWQILRHSTPSLSHAIIHIATNFDMHGRKMRFRPSMNKRHVPSVVLLSHENAEPRCDLVTIQVSRAERSMIFFSIFACGVGAFTNRLFTTVASRGMNAR